MARNWPELLLGLGVVFAGLIIGYEAATLKIAPLYSKVGPAAFLWFASALLVVCGAIVAWRGASSESAAGHEIAGPLTILAGLLVSVYLMEPLGFIPSAAVLFFLTARGMGSRAWLRDAIIGVVMATLAHVVFAMGLGLRLPVGSLFT